MVHSPRNAKNKLQAPQLAQFLPWESMYKLSIHVCTGRWAMATWITADVFFMKLSVVRAVQLYIAAAGQEWVFVLMPS